MKKKAVVFSFVIVFITTSCFANDNNKVLKIVDRPFKSNIELVWCDKNYTGEIKRDDKESIEISVSGQDLVYPILYSIKNGGLTTKTEGLEFSVPYRDAPPESLIITAYESFILLPQAEVKIENETVLLTHPKAVFVFDRVSNRMIKMQMKDGEISFIDFEYL